MWRATTCRAALLLALLLVSPVCRAQFAGPDEVVLPSKVQQGLPKLFRGTFLPPMPSGTLALDGALTVPTLSTTGTGAVYVGSATGLVLQGDGTANDVSLLNKSGTTICKIPTGGTQETCNALNVATGTVSNNLDQLLVNGTVAATASGTTKGVHITSTFAPTTATNTDAMNIDITLGNATNTQLNYEAIIANLTLDVAYVQTAPAITYFEANAWTNNSAVIPANFDQFRADAKSNGGNTSGTVINVAFHALGWTSVAGSGGTNKNYDFWGTVPSGSAAGTTNIGLLIDGNGGASSTNWAIQSTSTALSALSGGLGLLGTNLPTQAAGTLGLSGNATTPTLAANGEGDVFLLSTTGGLALIGDGSANDITVINNAGTTACVLTTATTIWSCGSHASTGTTAATPAAGTLAVAGEISTPTFAANGEGAVYLVSTTGGVGIMGKGSTNDLTLVNSGGTTACSIATNTVILGCGSFTATGTTATTPAAGKSVFAGEITTPTFAAGGEGAVFLLSTTGGLALMGDGSANDITVINSGGTTSCVLTTATTIWGCGSFSATGTSVAASAVGTLTISGIIAAPTNSGSGEGAMYLTASGGLGLQGSGSTNDVSIRDNAGSNVCVVPTGTTALSCTRVTVTGATSPTNGIYLPNASTTGVVGASALKFLVGSTNEMDFASTTASTWTLAAATTINSATFKVTTLAAGTAIDVPCYTTVTGLFTEEPTATTCTVSDERKKVGMKPISEEHSLDIIMKSKPISFFYRADLGDPDYHLGFGAQTLAKVAPELVERDKEGVPDAVKQIELLPVTWAAIKAMQKEIDQLKRRNSL